MEPPPPVSNSTCSLCKKAPSAFSLRTGESYTDKAGIVCQTCAVPYVDRPDSRFLVIPADQEKWMDEVRSANASITEVELLQNLFISQTIYAANTSIVRKTDAGPTRAREILLFAIPTAHAILGPFSPEILRALGFTSARAFGAIVQLSIDRGIIHPEPGDSIADFVSKEFDLFVNALSAP